jgi:hypothetical protein
MPLNGFNSQRRDITASSPAQRHYPFYFSAETLSLLVVIYSLSNSDM